MRSSVLSSTVLMDASESRIDVLRRSGPADARLVVDRLVETPVMYSRWLSFHFDIMKTVAAADSHAEQVVRLRKASFTLVHRQALFQHLRDSRITGSGREALLRGFHGDANYGRAVVTEHGTFLESNSSLFCARHLKLSLMNDSGFSARLDEYRSAYMEFFALYCNWVIAEARGQFYPFRPMFPEMKKQLLGMQKRLLTLPHAPDGAIARRTQGSFWG